MIIHILAGVSVSMISILTIIRICGLNKSSAIFSAIFIISLANMFFLMGNIVLQYRRESRIAGQHYENCKILLQELKCSIAEYDPIDGSIRVLEAAGDELGIENWIDSRVKREEFRRKHPEFDYPEMEREARLAVEKKETHYFETIYFADSGEIRWFKIILIPVFSDSKAPKVLGMALDVSDLHKDFQKLAETFKQIPGGVQRCVLDKPIHLEYFNEGLCHMLGYSRSELEWLMRMCGDYIQLVHPEDRQRVDAFAGRIAKTGGTATCEYRLGCKDGSYIYVSDTMDARRNATGVMYGYSVVTDLQKYQETQNSLKQELAETKERLELARIKNFTSQMHPHFLYNSLAAIREIVLDDPEYASELIVDFATHLRACLRAVTVDTLISFREELKTIDAYIRIEKMRFGEKLSVQYACEEKDFSIIPLSIQPLVENAIRHGIYERGREGGIVVVRTFRTEESICVQVEDNGVGFDFAATMQAVKDGTRDSTGLLNLIFRFEKILGAKVTVESRIGVGTRVTVSIPSKGEEL